MLLCLMNKMIYGMPTGCLGKDNIYLDQINRYKTITFYSLNTHNKLFNATQFDKKVFVDSSAGHLL